MKVSMKVLLAAAGIAGGLAMAGISPAMAQPNGFSFRVGDVAFGYSDGYYDNNRAWHAWNARERNWYRSHYRRNYRAMTHDRDHDGIADRFDRRPNNPYRH